MATRNVVRMVRPQASADHEVNRHTRQGLAGVRDRLGAKEESWPYLVSGLTGATGLALASLFGAAELAVGVAAAYVAYDVIARGVPLWDAIGQAEKKIEG